jgi:Sulfotransferase family
MEERIDYISEPISQQTLQRSIVVTGIPRGGTTLLGSLISNLENSYCISEPMAVEEQLHLSTTPEEFLGQTRAYFSEQRARILATGKAVNRIAKDGRPVTNYFRRIGKRAMVNEYVEAQEPVIVRDENFTLAVKHNAHFLSILPHLCNAPDISVIGILRHPIPTILSWRSLDLPISKGRLPSGEKFWLELFEVANSYLEVLVKQVMIYELIATRLLAFRERFHLLFYESLVNDPGQLNLLLNQRYIESATFQSSNRNKEYNWKEVQMISAVLKSHAPNTLRLYSMDDLDSPVVIFPPPLLQ